MGSSGLCGTAELAWMAKKNTKTSLPGSRTPRCPVTGDDVTDTPEETTERWVTTDRPWRLIGPKCLINGDL